MALVAACLAAASAVRLSAQTPGSLDTSFTAVDTGFTFFTQLYQLTDDDKPLLFVGGDRAGVNIFSLTGGFGLDAAVLPPFGSDARIIYTAVAEKVVEPNTLKSHNILVGGQFGRSAAQLRGSLPARNIFRLTEGGLIDDTFNPGNGADKFVTSIVTLVGPDQGGDAGMLVAGEFTTFNLQPHLRIVRLDNSGAIVPASVFAPNLSFDATILSMDAQTVGAGSVARPQFVVAGQFSTVNGATHPKLVRINYDGTVDSTFNPAFDDITTVVVCQPDGKILVGGDFSNVNGSAHKHVVRLNYDGSVDATFVAAVTGTPFGFVNPPAVYVIKLLDDGSMYLGGNFTTVNGVTRNYLAHVDANGVLDPTFDPGKNIINAVQSLTVQPGDGNLIVGETVSRSITATKYPPSLIRLFGIPPTLTLTASTANATESPLSAGAFTLTRSGTASTSAPLTVYLQLAKGAKQNNDYVPLKRNAPLTKYTADSAIKKTFSVTFQPLEDTITIPVIPTGATLASGALTANVTLTLLAYPGEAVDAPGTQTATVTISNE